MNLEFKKGDLVTVVAQANSKKTELCIIASVSVPCIYKNNELFMVYSVSRKEKFITTGRFMKKVVDIW